MLAAELRDERILVNAVTAGPSPGEGAARDTTPSLPSYGSYPFNSTERTMAKPLLQLAALGVAGVALWKIASIVLLPFLVLAFKVATIVALVMLAIWFFKRNDKGKDDAAA